MEHNVDRRKETQQLSKSNSNQHPQPTSRKVTTCPCHPLVLFILHYALNPIWFTLQYTSVAILTARWCTHLPPLQSKRTPPLLKRNIYRPTTGNQIRSLGVNFWINNGFLANNDLLWLNTTKNSPSQYHNYTKTHHQRKSNTQRLITSDCLLHGIGGGRILSAQYLQLVSIWTVDLKMMWSTCKPTDKKAHLDR